MSDVRRVHQFVQCEDCPEAVDLSGIHVAIEDDEGEFFLHVRCFLEGDWMRDDDVLGRGIAESHLNMN